jgi:hypothetical protein
VAAEQGYVLPAPNSSQSTDDYGSFGASSSSANNRTHHKNDANSSTSTCPIGYTVRLTTVSSPSTKVKFVTDGMLVRELLRDHLLSRYSVVIVDEAHERTLRTDVLVANLKAIIEVRNRRQRVPKSEVSGGDGKPATATDANGNVNGDVTKHKGKGRQKSAGAGDDADADASAPLNPLKVIIMSATLDAEKFSLFFDG